MVRRTKRSLHSRKVEEIDKEVRDFQWRVRQWAAEVPIESAVYLGLDPLNHCLGLMTRILNGERDCRGYRRDSGEGGME
ncbi:MAG: hypothetical protein EON58_18695 [Alphaproteobacteria bacterium]|nr:MAG: hypothetical protein EON58_18695 [Alphaproteobacteria bacterium]